MKFDDRTLVSFVSPATVDVEAAAKTVAERLPYYCVPTAILPLDDLPKTSRGKIDKRALMAMAKTCSRPIFTAVA